MLGRLFARHASPAARTEALNQVLILGAVTLVPFFFYFLIVFKWPEVWGKFFGAIFNGQMYLYAVTVCGSIFWNTIQGASKEDVYRRGWYLFFCVLCFGATGVYLSLMESGGGKVSLEHGILSVAFFIVSLVLWYLSLLFMQEPPRSVEKSNRDASESIAQGLKPYD
jgi:hypothetical protein